MDRQPGALHTAAAQVVNGQIISELINEVRQNGAPPLGADGFAPGSSFLHNGAVPSLTEVLDNVQHRSAGTSGVDVLSNPADRAKIVRFIESIDAATVPIP